MPDLLETTLRELRETPSEAFAADLDARVATRFGRRGAASSTAATATTTGGSPAAGGGGTRTPRRRRRLPGWLLPVGGFAVAATLCVAVVASTISNSGGGSDGAMGSGGASSAGSSSAAPAPQVGQSASGSTSRAAPPANSGSATPGRNRKVQRAAEVTLTVPGDRVETAAAGVSDVTERAGGYVERSDVERRDEATFVLRIPARRLDGAMAALARVGRVTSRRQSSEDITATFNAARAGLGEARALRTSLLRRLGAAQTDAQVASLRGRLRDANRRITANKTALRQVSRRASYAPVEVTVQARDGAAPDEADDNGGWGVGAALDDAGRGLEVLAGVLVLALAFLVPFALLVALGLGGRRAAVTRARRRALDAA